MKCIAPDTTFAFSGSEDEGFTTLYGVPVVEIGDEGGLLLALGHLDDRTVLAVTNAYHRGCGLRLLPTSEIADLAETARRTWARATRCAPGSLYDWEVRDAEPGTPGTMKVTWIDTEWLDYKDVAVQEECPNCGRPSRSTTSATGPGRASWGPYHCCRHCAHRWPAAPVYRPSLWKAPAGHGPRPGDCFACHCSASWPCTPGCSATPDTLLGQQVCDTCRSRHTSDTWRALAAVGYATTYPHYSFAEQRDRWLFAEALRGVPPAEAARAWQDRLALADRRAK